MIANPESKNIDHIVFKQPAGNLVNLSSFVHSYGTCINIKKQHIGTASWEDLAEVNTSTTLMRSEILTGE